MAEWLVEEGIGEHRAVLVEGGRIVAARLDWPGPLAAGLVEDAVLVSRSAGSARGTARFASGEQALVDRLPREASEGAPLRLAVTRAAMPERSRVKLAQARPTTDPPRPAPTLAEQLGARVVRELEGWEELWAEALCGSVEFSGGTLEFTPTAALTAVDIDGALSARELALAAVPALAQAIRRFDLAGSIVIDFPTLPAKADRQAVDAALAEALAGWPHEATAMNGFGLVQLVARRERASLLDLLTRLPDAAARMLLRRAERVTESGALQLSANSRVRSAFSPAWEGELARRAGRDVVWRIDDDLACAASFAQAVPR
ncbi:MAG: ribonuclease E/G [Novosphingobium sp.]